MSLQDAVFSEDVESDIKLFVSNEKRKRDPKLNGVRCVPKLLEEPAPAMGVEEQRSCSASPEYLRQRQVKSVSSVGIYRPPAARRAQSDHQAEQPVADQSAAAKTSRQRRPDRAVYVPRHRRSADPEGSPLPQETSRPVRPTRERLTTGSPVHKSPGDCGSSRTIPCQLVQASTPRSPSSSSEIVDCDWVPSGISSETKSGQDSQDSLPDSFPERNTGEWVDEISPGTAESPLIQETEESSSSLTVPELSDDSSSCRTFTCHTEQLPTNGSTNADHSSLKLVDHETTLENVSLDIEADSAPGSPGNSFRDSENIAVFQRLTEDDSKDFSSKSPLDNGVAEGPVSETPLKKRSSTCTGQSDYDSGLVLTSRSVWQKDSDSVRPRKTKRADSTVPDVVAERCSMSLTVEPKGNETGLIMNRKDQKTEEELLNRGEVVTHRNRRIIRQNVPSDVLIISDAERKDEATVKEVPVVPLTPPAKTPEKKVKKVERPKSKPAPPPSPPLKVNRDECDWDSLFDDNGDCLDPTLIEELTSAVGEVTIEQPRNDYKAFTRAPIEVSNDEFAHVLEIYNFPSDFKTSDLAAVFSQFKNGGFELKWVDDTHCLGVFSSPLIAAEVLASDHPFVKTRPLNEATALSRTKARRSAEFLQPYRSRPETCAALARRLVTGALGVRLATARQEREHEKIVLREAKEKRKLANKQRQDAWEGIIAEK